MFGITVDDVIEVYKQLKDRYDFILTTTFALDEGFTVDCPIIVGKAHNQIIELYEDGGDFVLDVMDEKQTKGTHWHPNDVEGAVDDIVKFMEGKSDYEMAPFRNTRMEGDAMFKYRKASVSDAATIAKMAAKLWNSDTLDDLIAEFEELLAGEDTAIFICQAGGCAIGFAQCQLRHDYVEGTSSSPVAYLEGVFVEESHRRRGCGKYLIHACEQWAKEKGCTEFASDCELDNKESLAFHLHSGFEEANRIICFVRKLQ